MEQNWKPTLVTFNKYIARVFLTGYDVRLGGVHVYRLEWETGWALLNLLNHMTCLLPLAVACTVQSWGDKRPEPGLLLFFLTLPRQIA